MSGVLNSAGSGNAISPLNSQGPTASDVLKLTFNVANTDQVAGNGWIVSLDQ